MQIGKLITKMILLSLL